MTTYSRDDVSLYRYVNQRNHTFDLGDILEAFNGLDIEFGGDNCVYVHGPDTTLESVIRLDDDVGDRRRSYQFVLQNPSDSHLLWSSVFCILRSQTACLMSQKIGFPVCANADAMRHLPQAMMDLQTKPRSIASVNELERLLGISLD